MPNKVKKAVLAALQRNTFTANQAIEVYTKGRHVVLMGSVESPDLIFEAIATAETVSPLIQVHNRLKVRSKEEALESAPVL